MIHVHIIDRGGVTGSSVGSCPKNASSNLALGGLFWFWVFTRTYTVGGIVHPVEQWPFKPKSQVRVLVLPYLSSCNNSIYILLLSKGE